jgi:hypothetical protein
MKQDILDKFLNRFNIAKTCVLLFNTDSAGAGGSQGWIKSAEYEPIDVSYLKAWT